jgi:hypothetical protein
MAASAQSGDRVTTSSVVDIWYEFRLGGDGPAGIDVPLLFDLTLTASSAATSPNALSTAQASFRVTTPIDEIFFEAHCGSQYPSYSDCANPSLSRLVKVNTQYGLVNRVNLHVNAGSSGGGLANAYADPFVRVDPSFAYASLYTIELSPGISNDAPFTPGGEVPEPSAIAMLVGGLGFLSYRKRMIS